MTLSQAALAVHGRLLGADERFVSVSTDSRALPLGSLFVALRGERFDGHAFVAQALAAGAAGAIVDELWRGGSAAAPELRLIVVEDTRRALGALAAHWRSRFALPLIGVVGSNGKTTVKEMIAAILRERHGARGTLATEGNFNNEIGLPLTLLRLGPEHRAAVIEIGMNHPGETAQLGAIARPTIGLINNAQREHQEFMRSVAEVAAEHGSLIDSLARDSCVVFNGDDEFASLWRKAAHRSGARVRDFSIERAAEVRGRFELAEFSSDIRIEAPEGKARFTLPLPGAHNVRNALAAAAAATAAGADPDCVERALSGFRGVKGRQQRTQSACGAALIDDSYNANPESVRAAIDVLSAVAPPTVLVLGDMGEVGEQGEAFHREAGAYAKSAGVSHLYGLGTLSRHAVDAFGPGAAHAGSLDELLGAIRAHDRPGATLLVKGSRFMRMERIVSALTGTQGRAH